MHAVLLAILLAFGAPPATPSARAAALCEAALAQIGVTKVYDPSYVKIDYPGGDVPVDRGVCTDVLVRAYRAVGQDLQRLVHEDMRLHFSAYPQMWGLTKPDPNIDHRRVANLQCFFRRRGAELPIRGFPAAYEPGDLVAWDLNGKGLLHIGIVVEPADRPGTRWIVHNIGAGAQLEDGLFAWRIIGHYRYGL
ncbi:MAG: DUF1287 domain-containing protein [Fimbriimonadaceae bacterium]|nr:DUF1287 domain-containing protein [Fimbriimonadaceae bacterium]